MNKSHLSAVILSAVLSTLFASSACAAIVVYTDRAAWESAAYRQFGNQNFENEAARGLEPGYNFANPLEIFIPFSQSPGFNAIDDSSTLDFFSDTLSPNGSSYYLGEVNFSGLVEPDLTFTTTPEQKVAGFGADWVIQGDLIMEIEGTLIPFSTYLTTGTGFLGIITDQHTTRLEVSLSGAAVFGMDNLKIAEVPVPGAIWLFGSGLLGMVGIAKHRKLNIQHGSCNT